MNENKGKDNDDNNDNDKENKNNTDNKEENEKNQKSKEIANYSIKALIDPKTPGKIPDIDKYQEAFKNLPKEIQISKYEKYKIVRRDEKDLDIDYDEEFDWYNYKSNTTYFCFTLENTW